MAIKGVFTSYSGIVGEKETDFESAILMYFPTGNALFTALSSGIESEPAVETTFHWYEDAHISGRTNCVSGGTTTTVVVGDGSFYIPNQILWVEETGEYIFVVDVVGNTLTVVRGFAGTTVVAITNAMNVQLISNAQEEGSSKPVAVTQQGVPRSNLVQIFRNAWSITGTAKAIKWRTGDRLARSKRECALYHSEDMERAYLFGRKTITTRNNRQFRTTDGIVTQIEQFGGTVVSAATDSGAGPVAGEMSFKDMLDIIRRTYKVGVKGMPNERMVFCGDLALQAVQQMTMADGSYEIKSNETELGIKVMKLVTAFADLDDASDDE